MIGQTVSHYKILDKLGEGGMGVVYKAQDLTLDRIVALKFLPHHVVEDESARTRFLREARAAAKLNHPNICTVHSVEESEGSQFIVMEFIDGVRLRNALDRGQLSPGEAVTLACGIAEGLAAAHAQGIVHRDLKPENIILTAGGVPKISDFGLAHNPHAPGTAGSAEAVAGTIAYMSPEQLRGGTVDARSDLWSFGVVLYELLAGQRPFRGDYVEALEFAIGNESHRPLGSVRPDVSAGLASLVEDCLQKDPDRRVAAATTVLDRLKAETLVAPPTAAPPERCVAVLPLADLSPRQDNQYFSDGLTEEITTRLSKLKGVRLISRTSMMRYDRRGKGSRQIATDVGAQYLLDGSVRKQGTALRVTTQLIDAQQDVALWAESFDGKVTDVFAIQETVARKVARALKLRLTPAERKSLTRRPTMNAEAYQLYLRGRYFWNKRSEEAMRKAVTYFEQALRKDERFAQAWTGIADAFNLLAKDGDAQQKVMYQKARDAAERALKIDNKLAEAHTSLAILIMLEEWDWDRSEKEYKLALRLNPRYETAHHWYSTWLLYQGRLEESLAELTRAAELDPLSPAILKDKGLTLYYARRNEEAIDYANKALELEPEFAQSFRLISLALLALGRFAESREANERWGRLTGNVGETAIGLAYICACAGDSSTALRLVEGVRPETVAAGSLCRGIALVHTALGHFDQAFVWIERGITLRAEALFSLNVDPKMDPLRSDPRFDALVRRLGLQRQL